MADFRVEKVSSSQHPDRFTVITYIDAIDDAQKPVRVENGKQVVTLDQLVVRKGQFQARMDEVQGQIDAINALVS